MTSFFYQTSDAQMLYFLHLKNKNATFSYNRLFRPMSGLISMLRKHIYQKIVNRDPTWTALKKGHTQEQAVLFSGARNPPSHLLQERKEFG